MNVDCQWIEKNLEALFCDGLSEGDDRLARAHIDACASCRSQVQALRAIDPLIKSHFRHELEIARRPRLLHKGRVLGLTGAAAAVVALSLLLVMRTPSLNSPVALPGVLPPSAAPTVSVETPAPIKTEEQPEPIRAKPSAAPAASPDRQAPTPPPVTSDATDFLVTDPAGYSHSIGDYRGHMVVIGVWKSDQTETVSNLERLYKANAANTNLRLLAVSTDRSPKPANTTFPIVYNQGSKLFGAQPGEFVVLDENGVIELRGSLVKNFDTLTKVLRR
jgi:hypothetical protein